MPCSHPTTHYRSAGQIFRKVSVLIFGSSRAFRIPSSQVSRTPFCSHCCKENTLSNRVKTGNIITMAKREACAPSWGYRRCPFQCWLVHRFSRQKNTRNRSTNTSPTVDVRDVFCANMPVKRLGQGSILVQFSKEPQYTSASNILAANTESEIAARL
jgi:hypothetical protein